MSGPSVNVTPLNPLSFLRRTSAIYPDSPAVIHGSRRYTYEQFAGRVRKLAAALRRSGLQAEDRVAVLLPNIPAMLEAHFGVPAAGGTLVAINTRLNAAEIVAILEHSGARILLIDEEYWPRLASADLSKLRVIRVADTGNSGDPYEDFLNSIQESISPETNLWFELCDENQTISINYTSGTTGSPKGVMYSFRGAYLNSLNQLYELRLNSESVFLWTLPMFHCNGWCCPWAVTAAGAAHVCLRRVDPTQIWSLFGVERITHYCGAPTVQTILMNHASARRLDPPVTVMVAGAPPSPALLGLLRSANIHPVHVYGLTETYGPVSSCVWHREFSLRSESEQAALLARQGQAQLTLDLIRVVDDNMQDVPHDGRTMGEVVMRGNIVMKGYFRDLDATSDAFRGGWFHSGDLAVWHPTGDIELRDRRKDIIISGGENISTIEVEQCVAGHPAVLECAVVAVRDEIWGERPKAFVTLRSGEVATENDILTYCRKEMAHFKCPVAVEFCELPKTSTGKIQKYVLRERESR
jgi:fatty-acyl-CoA synthase